MIEKINEGEHEVILPAVVLVEVVSALVRRTQDESMVDEAVNLIFRLPNLEFLEIDQQQLLTEINSFNVEGRYPEEKLEFHQKATKRFAHAWIQKIEAMYLWLSKQNGK